VSDVLANQTDARNVESYQLLSELAAESTGHTQLRDEVLNILLAARDITGSLLANAFLSKTLRYGTKSEMRLGVSEKGL